MRYMNMSCCAVMDQATATFRKDVIKGLSAADKYLEPKYFYDANGDRLFQQIMASPEYYLTDAEMEILSLQSAAILGVIRESAPAFDIIELGAGDASKSVHLLRQALKSGSSGHYYPIDISGNVIHYLERELPEQLPGLEVTGLAGEYFPMLDQLQQTSGRPKLVLFLGATIGNMLQTEALTFFKGLHAYLNEGDFLLTGFDLKKDPKTILDAYNDRAGITRDFNLNLLHRINEELGGNFNSNKFVHYPVYDPGTGACKSYLISKEQQVVTLDHGQGPSFFFEESEAIYMEVSLKYDQKTIRQMAARSGFEHLDFFSDRKHLFVDALWKVPSLKQYWPDT